MSYFFEYIAQGGQSLFNLQEVKIPLFTTVTSSVPYEETPYNRGSCSSLSNISLCSFILSSLDKNFFI